MNTSEHPIKQNCQIFQSMPECENISKDGEDENS